MNRTLVLFGGIKQVGARMPVNQRKTKILKSVNLKIYLIIRKKLSTGTPVLIEKYITSLSE
jgi:hypothetical protein